MPDMKDVPPEVHQAALVAASKAGVAQDDVVFALLVAMAELVNANSLGTNGEVKAMQNRLEKLEKAIYYVKMPQERPESVLKRWLCRVAIGAALVLVGFTLGELREVRSSNDHLQDVIDGLNTASRPVAWLYAHGGSITREPIAAPWHEGIVIRKGNLAEPWISGDGAAVIPIP
jgi:hypothetical protein